MSPGGFQARGRKNDDQNRSAAGLASLSPGLGISCRTVRARRDNKIKLNINCRSRRFARAGFIYNARNRRLVVKQYKSRAQINRFDPDDYDVLLYRFFPHSDFNLYSTTRR